MKRYNRWKWVESSWQMLSIHPPHKAEKHFLRHEQGLWLMATADDDGWKLELMHGKGERTTVAASGVLNVDLWHRKRDATRVAREWLEEATREAPND